RSIDPPAWLSVVEWPARDGTVGGMDADDEATWTYSRRVPAWARPFRGAPHVSGRLLRAQGALLQFAGVEPDALADADRVGRRLELVAAGQVARRALVLARDGAERVAARDTVHARAFRRGGDGARCRRALVVDHRQRRIAAHQHMRQ